ncbi:MAG: LysE family transporter [Alphaproteobacteria bacterium]|nr:LysE family transporter [Alphaproteobacteria bacterium]
MDIQLLVTGMVVGFLVAAPVGPVAVLCIQRTLLDGRLTGYATGLGATLADALFGALAVLSVGAVDAFLTENRMVIQGLGGVILVVLGSHAVWKSKTLSRTTVSREHATGRETLVRAFATALAVTLFNPVTFIAFISLFAAIHVLEAIDGFVDSWVVISGILAGAAAWWFTLATISAWMRSSFTGKGLAWLNAGSGLVVLAFGIYALGALLS